NSRHQWPRRSANLSRMAGGARPYLGDWRMSAKKPKKPEPELFREIRDELKRSVRLLLDQLRGERPDDHFYAVLFDVDVSQTRAFRVVGSEETLTRLAERYIGKGYRTKTGDQLENLRILLRWDAPGDNRHGWHLGNEGDDAAAW